MGVLTRFGVLPPPSVRRDHRDLKPRNRAPTRRPAPPARPPRSAQHRRAAGLRAGVPPRTLLKSDGLAKPCWRAFVPPHNVLLKIEGLAKLADFGASAELSG
eukprot:gene883-3330_t